MASPRDLRRRIKSIRGTAQITKAMQMVAASKMRKAQQAAIAAAPFAHRLYRIQRSATSRTIDFRHPLIEVRPVRRRAVVLVAADKGLCGALNTNVFRLATKYAGQRLSLVELEPELDLEAPQPAAAAGADIADQAQRQLERAGAFDLDQTLKAWERAYIEAALKLTRGNVSQAAKLLGMNRTTLYSRLNTGEDR